MGLCLSSPTLGSAHPGYYGQRPPSYAGKDNLLFLLWEINEENDRKRKAQKDSLDSLNFIIKKNRRLRRGLRRLRRIDARRLRPPATIWRLGDGRRDGGHGAFFFCRGPPRLRRKFRPKKTSKHAHTLFSSSLGNQILLFRWEGLSGA